MPTDSTVRFSDRADSYVRGRPDYPVGVLDAIASQTKWPGPLYVADVGSGTGIFSRLLLGRGHTVYAVEPNRPMRHAAEAALGSESRFHSIEGSAEVTTLPDDSVDVVTAAQAFHWFDPIASRVEWNRILRAPAWVFILSNDRRTGPGLGDAYEDFVLRWGGSDYVKIKKSWDLHASLDQLFLGEWRELDFPNAQRLDLAGLEARMVSSSYMPGPSDARHAPMLAEAHALFETYQTDGAIDIGYDTHVYVGRLR